MSTQSLSGARFEDKMLENLIAVFGCPSKSDLTDESCMAEKEAVNTSLKPLDKAVLTFLYKEVPAGTRPAELNNPSRHRLHSHHVS